MPTFYVEATIGGRSIIKVEAPTKEQAYEAARVKAADDWNEAGYLRSSDVRALEAESQPFDASITVTVPGTDQFPPQFEVATDDPDYYPED